MNHRKNEPQPAVRKKGEAGYIRLYKKLREEILSGIYPYGAKLPSKRLLSEELSVSVITVEHAYDILSEEGYVQPKERSGYFVSYREQDGFAPPEVAAEENVNLSKEEPSSPAGPSPLFPFSVFAKTMRRVLSERGEEILVKSPNTGCRELKAAIAGHLARFRGIVVSPEQIIIGSGAEYLYGLIVQMLGRNLIYGIENPSYEKIEQVYRANDVSLRLLPLGKNGILSSALSRTDAEVLHTTPYRSYPSGVTADAGKRREYIRWADEKPGRCLIEDDFESEFTPAARPEETVFSMAKEENVIYLNTFSRTVAPSIRTGYMILPERMLPLYEERAGFYSCSVPAFDQYVLAEFIAGGDFERHINRVRRQNRLLRESR